MSAVDPAAALGAASPRAARGRPADTSDPAACPAPSAVERVRSAYAAIEAAGRPEVWISLRPIEAALREAAEVDADVVAGLARPLAGLVAAVKDNIDVLGMPTTAGAPSYAYTPERDATAVRRLREAGAVVLGKTNLDQFATGLVGTRSPYGAVRSAIDVTRVSGGSSSGSAVAVALGLVDLALGTDTAGSGRVPAALNGIVGIKPTRGLIPCTGVVPACRSLDCVTVFARSLPLARQAVALMSGPDGTDPLATLLGARPRFGGWESPAWQPTGGKSTGGKSTGGQPVDSQPAAAQPAAWQPTAGKYTGGKSTAEKSADGKSTAGKFAGAPVGPRLAVPLPSQLDSLADGWGDAFEAAAARFREAGCTVAPVDIAPLLEAATLLYGGAFVAERYAAVGAHIEAHKDLIGDTLDPVVASIILDSARHGAVALFADRERLDRLAASAAAALDGFDALLTPTTTAHPLLTEVAADPVGVNARLGRYTNFCNLLDLAALAVPAGTVAGLPFGIMLTGPATTDDRLAAIAELLS